MEKRPKWQLFLILAVIALTIYNILPTLFYYIKPLKENVTERQGSSIATQIQKRVNLLEQESVEWLESFCDLLQIKPLSIAPDADNPQWVTVSFSKTDDATRFRAFLPRAGSLIPFSPSQLTLPPQDPSGREVRIQRRIPIRFDESEKFFSFVSKDSEQYQKLAIDRAVQVALSLAGTTDSALSLKAIEKGNFSSLESLVNQICSMSEIFGENRALATRYAAHLTQGKFADRPHSIKTLISTLDQSRDQIKRMKEKELSGEDLRLLEKKEAQFAKAGNLLKKWETQFAAGEDPWDDPLQIEQMFTQNPSLSIGRRNPLFSEVSIDFAKERILLKLHPEAIDILNQKSHEQLLIDEVAKISRLCNETVKTDGRSFEIPLNELSEVSALLVLNLEKVAKVHLEKLLSTLKISWHPHHPDLQNLPIIDYATYESLPVEQKPLCLVVCNPLVHRIPHLHNHSLYLIAKGFDRISRNYEQFPDSELARIFEADLRKFTELLQQNGFFAYPPNTLPIEIPLSGDFLFEKTDFSSALLSATREDFKVQGTQKYARLELSNKEQRLLTENKIETRIHEDLIKWRDEFRSCQVSLSSQLRYDVPKPTNSIFWSNVALSARKFFRGDERKIIRWGLDLSGGKTVQIELRDANHIPVRSDADLKQGINELYNRVNKIGVSEVSIRQVGHHIVLDFPGSQAFSAAELIKASTMYFHVINEKFSTQNPSLRESVNRFLQEVWNDAVVSGKKDVQSVNEIAWRHLYGNGEDPSKGEPRSEAGRTLWENGLRLQSPLDPSMSNAIDDSVSKIAVLRGTDYAEWHGQTHPLLLIFRNYALEGSQLENIRSSYDPSKGNYLSFGIIGSSLNREGQKINPRNDLFAWTSRFSKEKVVGTPNEAYSRGRGWRMAVLLNDTVINAPTLDSALRDSAMISGSFSQREVQRLAADLKAGSLTFTPHILSEKNVSPELGQNDRVKGITATCVALLLVIGAIVTYYRFAGVIASIAVLFNLLILWATLQNLGATLTLAGIAGVILTVAMAVDANVLVFERIKEEFAISGRISTAISAGYKKAFSAIIDSNVTTIIAALILLNFDAGPIKNFATNLIIGIVSSMFTALFLTRFYFSGWVQNPKNKILKMSHWIHATTIDFLKRAKLAFRIAAAIIAVGGYLIFSQSATIFGMDFTGGFSLNLELKPNGSTNYAEIAEKALHAKGLTTRDFQVRELSPSNHLRILLGTTLEQNGKPFFGLPVENGQGETKYPFQKNPRITWVVDAVESAGLEIAPQMLPQLDSNWTSMSGQMSESMRNNAIVGLLIAFLCIFIYLSFRFEYKFAAAALICVLHDVGVTIGLIGLLHAIGVPLQIDLNTVAALMTIVGYSLNDTIIIFDRIREEMRLTQGRNLREIVNSALNSTLSRTSITSGTTLLVLIALVVLGGASIFSFALVMTIGVVFGTLSSWFIASPLMLFFHRQEEKKETRALQN